MTFLSSPMSFGGRTLGRLVALTAVLAGVLIAGAGSAHADYYPYSVTERFGVNAPVEFGVGGTGGGQLITNTTTGAGHANLWVQNPGSWSFVSRRYNKGAANDWCKASAFVNAHSALRAVKLQAVDAVTGGLVHQSQFVVSGYRQIATPQFQSSLQNLKVRVVLISDGSSVKQTLDADDLKLDCFYIY